MNMVYYIENPKGMENGVRIRAKGYLGSEICPMWLLYDRMLEITKINKAEGNTVSFEILR